jgi:hypothetical protein
LSHFLLKHHAKTYGYAEDGGARKAPYPARSTSGEIPNSTHWTADFVDPRVGLDDVQKRKIPVHTGNRTQIIWFAAWTQQKKGKSLSTPEIEPSLFGLRLGRSRKKEKSLSTPEIEPRLFALQVYRRSPYCYGNKRLTEVVSYKKKKIIIIHVGISCLEPALNGHLPLVPIH